MQFYRPDIDGLRAVSIIPVVLFHANVPGFSGGFVGVDVFLVISGFLITSIIQREIVEGRFTVARFYERRARRILPAFFFMMLAVVIGAALLLLPHQYLAHSRAVVAATLFLSSFLFRSEDGYFDLSSEEKPLLHTWSLSVEEVFYVFFPLIILLSARYAARRQLLVLGVIGALSFMVSVVTLHQDNASKAAFFLPHFRAWEFLLGAVLALSPWAELRVSKLQEGMAALGLVMILVAVIVYSKETVF